MQSSKLPRVHPVAARVPSAKASSPTSLLETSGCLVAGSFRVLGAATSTISCHIYHYLSLSIIIYHYLSISSFHIFHLDIIPYLPFTFLGQVILRNAVPKRVPIDHGLKSHAARSDWADEVVKMAVKASLGRAAAAACCSSHVMVTSGLDNVGKTWKNHETPRILMELMVWNVVVIANLANDTPFTPFNIHEPTTLFCKRLHSCGKQPWSMAIYQRTKWPFSIAFCMFTRPGNIRQVLGRWAHRTAGAYPRQAYTAIAIRSITSAKASERPAATVCLWFYLLHNWGEITIFTGKIGGNHHFDWVNQP